MAFTVATPVDEVLLVDIPTSIKDLKNEIINSISSSHTVSTNYGHAAAESKVMLTDYDYPKLGLYGYDWCSTDNGRLNFNKNSKVLSVYIHSSAGVWTSWTPVKYSRVLPQEDIDMNGYQINNLGTGLLSNDSVKVSQFTDDVFTFANGQISIGSGIASRAYVESIFEPYNPESNIVSVESSSGTLGYQYSVKYTDGRILKFGRVIPNSSAQKFTPISSYTYVVEFDKPFPGGVVDVNITSLEYDKSGDTYPYKMVVGGSTLAGALRYFMKTSGFHPTGALPCTTLTVHRRGPKEYDSDDKIIYDRGFYWKVEGY